MLWFKNEQNRSKLIGTEKWMMVNPGGGAGVGGGKGERDKGAQKFSIVTEVGHGDSNTKWRM